ncbi:MAG TPA: tripartite tricarboxylate transporter TctB family protein, partial [Thermodesulfobacteriota bacterium]|nr:tripartite tricarboxylate transporter TctB family protein [Thermodesulfobacteriota bacterium]
GPAAAPADAEDEPPGSWPGRARLAAAVLLTAAYVALLERLGYLPSTAAYLAALLALQGGVPLRPFLLTVFGLPLLLFLVFGLAMRVPLPRGLLALAGLSAGL